MKNWTRWATGGVLLGCVFVGCGPVDLLNNPSLDLWCGDSLCSWEVEAGSVEPAPTWHESDLGVRLVGEVVVLSQVSAAPQVECIEFSVLAQRDEGVTLSLELDFLDDGEVEFTEGLTADNWGSSSAYVHAPTWYERLRFRLRKGGAGDAVIGQIRATEADPTLCSTPRIPLVRPVAKYCEAEQDCESGVCLDIHGLSACSECDESSDCHEGACGVQADRGELLYAVCAEAGRHGLGEVCVTSEECGSGTCCGGVCSSCCVAEDCAGAETCRERRAEDVVFESLGRHCAGVERQSGEACAFGDECASGVCEGPELRRCSFDGRACEADEDCLWGGGCRPTGLNEGSCR